MSNLRYRLINCVADKQTTVKIKENLIVSTRAFTGVLFLLKASNNKNFIIIKTGSTVTNLIDKVKSLKFSFSKNEFINVIDDRITATIHK